MAGYGGGPKGRLVDGRASEPGQLFLGLTLGSPARGQDAIVTRDDGSVADPVTDEQWRDWVSAGATRFWSRRNELIDWLELHGIDRGFAPDTMRSGYD